MSGRLPQMAQALIHGSHVSQIQINILSNLDAFLDKYFATGFTEDFNSFRLKVVVHLLP